MAAIELVADRESKKAADKKTMARVADGAYEAGVMVRVSGNNIILSPPLILTPADVTESPKASARGCRRRPEATQAMARSNIGPLTPALSRHSASDAGGMLWSVQKIRMKSDASAVRCTIDCFWPIAGSR